MGEFACTLKEENQKLRNELHEVRSLYNQLVEETSHEKFDERRVNLLKSQVIQLERQLLLMSDGLSSRLTALQEVENALTWLADHCRSYISMEIKGPEVPIPRSSLTQMVTTVESARIKLYKNIENASKESLSKPLLFMNGFISPEERGQTTLFDICAGGMEHINLKQVSKLESKLCQLYRDLVSVHEAMMCGTGGKKLSSLLDGKAATERLSTQMLKACARLDDCARDLLSLSLLYPAAPWPPLRRPLFGDVTPDRVILALPSLPRNKQQEIHRVIEALIKATNHRQYIKEHEIKALKEELNFHQATYNLQTEYIGSLFEAVKCGYKDFEVNVEQWLCTPLTDILESYEGLKTSASEDALRIFLKTFKDRADKLESTVKSLSTSPENGLSSGVEGLSAFGEGFFKSLDKLCKDCQQKRDSLAEENTTLQEAQGSLDSALQILLDQRQVVKNAALEKEKESRERGSFDKTSPKNEGHDNRDGYVNHNAGSVNQLKKPRVPCDPSKSNFETEFQKMNLQDLNAAAIQDMDTVGSGGLDFINRESKLRPPSAGNRPSSRNVTSPKRPERENSYSSNRTLQLRRSGSLSRLGQSRLPSPGGASSEFPSTLKKCGSMNAVDPVEGDASSIDQTKSSKIPSSPARRMSKKSLPTTKAPFR